MQAHQPSIARYYVIGNPVQHSLSPEIHKQFAAQTQQNVIYETLLVDIDSFSETLEKQRFKIHGANVTLPFKRQAYSYSQQLTPHAEIARAVNTLKWTENDECFGDNTDGAGLVNDFLKNLHWSFAGNKILVLGAGGAARGIIKPLLDQNPEFLMIANRTIHKAQQLAKEFSRFGPIQPHLDQLASIKSAPFDLIINATSCGVNGSHLPLNSKIISQNTLCYDLFYSNQPTDFMNWAKAQGCRLVVDGLGMLVEQAAESFYFWRGVKPETSIVIKSIRNILSQKNS